MSPDQPTMHEDGSITLPPNPFGTAATWVDYNWRGIAAALRERLDGQSAECPDVIPAAAGGTS